MPSRGAAAGRLLAARHGADGAQPEPAGSLVAYAESPRTDDWSLRSALVRLAQPEPTRAGAVLELVRRCDHALHPFTRALERGTVVADRTLSLDDIVEVDGEWVLAAAGDPYPDARMADLARLSRGGPEVADEVVAAYAESVELSDHELAALPLLVVALELDALAAGLAAWAAVGPASPPLELVDRTCAHVHDRLGQLGVPRETGPPGRDRPRGR